MNIKHKIVPASKSATQFCHPVQNGGLFKEHVQRSLVLYFSMSLSMMEMGRMTMAMKTAIAMLSAGSSKEEIREAYSTELTSTICAHDALQLHTRTLSVIVRPETKTTRFGR